MPQYLPPQQPDENMLLRLGRMLFPPDDMRRGMLGRGGYPGFAQPQPMPHGQTAAGTFQYREPPDPNAPPVPIPGRNPRQVLPAPLPVSTPEPVPMPQRRPMPPPQQLQPGVPMPGRKPGISLAEALNRAVQSGEQIHQGMDPRHVAAIARAYGYTGEYR
jgi:hypothetical protein